MDITIKIDLHIHLCQTDGKTNYCNSQTGVDNKNEMHQPIINLIEEEIERLKASKSPSTISNYLTALRSFVAFAGKNVILGDISSETFKAFEKMLYQKDVGRNTISCYMRSLRSLLAKVCGRQTHQLFSQVYTGRTRTEKRAITESDIVKLMNQKLKAGSFLSLVRDLFLFSFYAHGMPFVDMAFLKHREIRDGKIVYYRHKTGLKIVVKLEPNMIQIINRYQTIGSTYVFPLLHSEDTVQAYSEYLLVLNRYNRALKELAKKAGVNKCLTSYTPRHTWASTAYKLNVDLPIISKALGHTNPQTTLTYIREIDDQQVEEANRIIVAKISEIDNQ